MIYYYFDGKEGLYQAVLEKAYMDIRSLEERAQLLELAPMEAMRKLIELTFDYDETHPQFISLVSVENIHQAKHMKEPAIHQGWQCKCHPNADHHPGARTQRRVSFGAISIRSMCTC